MSYYMSGWVGGWAGELLLLFFSYSNCIVIHPPTHPIQMLPSSPTSVSMMLRSPVRRGGGRNGGVDEANGCVGEEEEEEGEGMHVC